MTIERSMTSRSQPAQQALIPGIARLVLSALAGAAYFGPHLTGCVPDMVFKAYAGVGVLIMAYLALSHARHPNVTGAIVACLATTLCVTFSDLVLRPLSQRNLYYRPDEMFIRSWPPNSTLARYVPDASFTGMTYGDLAAKTGALELRDPREVEFVTDRNGFRNRPAAADEEIDLLLLGDSFGVGTGTTQDETLAALLHAKYGHAVYNLSMTGNPYQELVSLIQCPADLRLKPDATVLWLLYSGNDLFGEFPEGFAPVVAGRLQQLKTRFATFRNRSPIREYMRRWIWRWKPAASAGMVVAKPFPGARTMLFYEPYLWVRTSTLSDITSYTNYPRFAATILEMNRYTREQGWRLAVAVVPTKAEVYPWVVTGEPPWTGGSHESGFAEAVEQLCASNNVPFLDLQADFIVHARQLFEDHGQLLWWYDDTHWNGQGQLLAAEVLESKLLGNRR